MAWHRMGTQSANCHTLAKKSASGKDALDVWGGYDRRQNQREKPSRREPGSGPKSR
jgi:hypothetical protein